MYSDFQRLVLNALRENDEMVRLYISKSEFMSEPLAYIRRVETSGQTIVIMDADRPTVEISRYRSRQRSPLETLKGSVISYIDPLEPVDWSE